MLHVRAHALVVCLIALLIAAGLQAQSNPTLSGMVLDASGKAIPRAEVTARSEAGGTVRKAITEADGRFSIGGLQAGAYTVEATAPGFATTSVAGVQLTATGAGDLSISLKVANLSQTVTVEATASIAAALAPSGNTLDAVSAKTEITPQFIENFTSPVSDFSEIVNMAPGTFAINSNGVGLGQAKTYFRGFSNTQYSMTYDGIPFEDTNDGSHHSWAFFPGQWIGGVDFDRSPGGAGSFGPSNFGGSINLLSHEPQSSPDIRATAAYGSFNTRLLDLALDSGQFGGKDKKHSVFVDVHQLLSDGFQTYNYQKRIAGSMKYQYRLDDKTTISLYTGILDDWNNTPDTNQPTRDQVAQFGYNFLLNGDPSSPYYYGYGFYHIQSDFDYLGIKRDLGHGWKVDDKMYTYRYWNKQNLIKDPTQALSATAGVDKLNGYRYAGNMITASQENRWGIFRSGFWYQWAYTDRYQYKSSPFSWADFATPNFHEHYIQTTVQPFAEFEWHATPRLSVTVGLKDVRYTMDFNQFQDLSKVGCLGGTVNKAKTACVGGDPSVQHGVVYNSVLPTGAARYRLQRNWSVYAQFGEGSVIPPTSVFDVPNGAVGATPNPTLAKTYQVGTVVKFNRWTLDFDGYYIHFQNPYASVNDPSGLLDQVYVPTGPSNTKGLEAEGNIFIVRGLSLYLNGTLGAARYQQTGLWVANAPSDTEGVGLTLQEKNWNIGFLDKRIGKLYNDNGSLNQAVPIDPFSVANANVGYTVRNSSFLRGTKIGLSVNNLFDNHAITGITPGTKGTTAVPFTPNGLDQLYLLPGRSVMISLTFGYAPRR